MTLFEGLALVFVAISFGTFLFPREMRPPNDLKWSLSLLLIATGWVLLDVFK